MPPERAPACALLVDFGSTFTKLLLVDLPSGAILARASHPTTVRQGIAVGLQAGLDALGAAAGPGGAAFVRQASPRLACSSAAGGLRMVAVGLVRELTAAAATAAALGAGARLLATYCHRLSPVDLAEIHAQRPDIVLLAGGTDGGDRETLVHNAAALATLPPSTLGPVVVAGNKEVTPAAVATLRQAGHDARQTANVLPELGRLDVAPAQDAIRQVFLQRIVNAKGLDQALAWLDGVVLPTPAAVLQAAGLLTTGRPADLDDPHHPHHPDDVVIVDVGGATTDVHSAGDGAPARADVYRRGFPEPRLKRTVEGDLGLRFSASSTWEAVATRWGPGVLDGEARPRAGLDPDALAARLAKYARHPARLPDDALGQALDAHLAVGAAALSLERHAGTLEELATPAGRFWVQRGKDLTTAGTLIGSGGIFRSAPHPLALLSAAAGRAASDPLRLAPRRPRLAVDDDYVLWAAGLLAPSHPEAARRLAWRSLAFAPLPVPVAARALSLT